MRAWKKSVAACAVAAVTLMMAAPVAQAEEPHATGEIAQDPGGNTLPDQFRYFADAISELADEQLEPDPTSRSPQQSIDFDQLADDLSLPSDGPGSLIVDDFDRVAATVSYETLPDDEALAALQELGAAVDAVNERYFVVSVDAAPQLFDDIAALPGVRSVAPSLTPRSGGFGAAAELLGRGSSPLESAISSIGGAPILAADTADGTGCGPIPIEADEPLRAKEARDTFGVDGTGVTIGIISDTFDKGGLPTTWEEDVASGALPGPENPCGRTEPVELVGPVETTWSDGDEGRAMAQLVHGIAPGAKILFADAGDDTYEFIKSIEALADAGADIIVDDIGLAQEPHFQQGPLGVAISEVRSEHGILYFTSAGNGNLVREVDGEPQPINGWSTEAYRGVGCPDWVLPSTSDDEHSELQVDCMDFDPGEGVTPYETLTFVSDDEHAEHGSEPEHPGEEPEPIALDVWGSVGEAYGGPQSLILMCFYEEEAGEWVRRDCTSRSEGYPTFVGRVKVDPDRELRLVLVRVVEPDMGTDGPPIWFEFVRNGSYIETRTAKTQGPDVVGSTVHGHSGDGSAIGVASLHWDNPKVPRNYSSLGPNTMYFEPATGPEPAARLAEPREVSSPMLAAVDGTQTTFFGAEFEVDGELEYRFFGTSAAAPHAAAVAALGLSYNPDVAASDLEQYLLDTADAAITNPYAGKADANVFGAGRVDAVALLKALPVPDDGGDDSDEDESDDDGGGGGEEDSSGSDPVAPGSNADGVDSAVLEDTGSENAVPWLIAAGALVLIGAAVMVVVAVRKRRG